MRMVKEQLKKISNTKRNLELTAHNFIPGMVSVCMPNYNKQDFIEKSIKSIVDQTYKNIELCVVDDCSTDRSQEIIKDLERQYKNQIRFKKLFLPKRVGCAWAQNMAYYLSEGEYIANMDSDDISKHFRIQKQLEFLKSGNYDLVGTNFSIFRDYTYMPDLTDGGIWLKYDEEDIQDSYLIDGVHCICFGTALFHRKVLEETGGLDKTFIGTEDYGFIDKVASKGFKLGNTREILYYYRSSNTQRSKLFHSS